MTHVFDRCLLTTILRGILNFRIGRQVARHTGQSGIQRAERLVQFRDDALPVAAERDSRLDELSGPDLQPAERGVNRGSCTLPLTELFEQCRPLLGDVRE